MATLKNASFSHARVCSTHVKIIRNSGAYFFFGGFLQILTGILEWILGNTYPSVVFATYGAFFLTFGGTLNPGFAAVSTYAPPGEDASAGLTTRGFNASFGRVASLWC